MNRDPSLSASELVSESEKACRKLARSHYENFLVATILLPRRLRQPFYNVYAFCRTADDAADESESTEIAIAKLDQLQHGLDAIFAGDAAPVGLPEIDLFPALRDTVQAFSLDRQPFNDLLSAFRQDQTVHRYDNMPQLLDYCRRSANPVGRIVLQLGDSLNAENAALADEICTGLQLVNFWQDVARDLLIGRVYLPAERMQQAGVSEDMLHLSSTPSPLRKLLAELCDEAERHLRAGLPLTRRVPKWLASDVRLFAGGGLATAAAIRAIDYDVLRVRPVVGKRQQLGLLAKAFLRRT